MDIDAAEVDWCLRWTGNGWRHRWRNNIYVIRDVSWSVASNVTSSRHYS